MWLSSRTSRSKRKPKRKFASKKNYAGRGSLSCIASPTASASSDFRFEGVVGKGGGIDKIYQLIQKVAAGSTNVLITGESGTGKELVARAIHFNGARQDKPFVAVNCGAIPETLIESELFGHVRGAFTGAVSDHAGLFKQADQGTIFLDEVAELPLHLQVKLLRVLQEKSFTPVGGSKQVKVDVRVISASNRDLRKEMEEGRFREDLFYRLNVVQMVLPPLKNRKDDIPALAHYFLRKFAASHGKQVEEISSGALMRLMNHNFPGNVRELENVLEHAVAVTSRNIITEEDLPSQLKNLPPVAVETAGLADNGAGGNNSGHFFSKGVSLDAELETHERAILVDALKTSQRGAEKGRGAARYKLQVAAPQAGQVRAPGKRPEFNRRCPGPRVTNFVTSPTGHNR